MLAITDPKKQYSAALHIIETGTTTREMEKRVQIPISFEEQKRNQILYKKIEDKFQNFFGSKVQIDAGRKRGRIIIEYTSNDDLTRIMGLIK